MTDRKLSSTEFTELDFIANLLYREHNLGEPAIGPRWWCLRDDLKNRWRREALSKFVEWAHGEQAMMEIHSGR